MMIDIKCAEKIIDIQMLELRRTYLGRGFNEMFDLICDFDGGRQDLFSKVTWSLWVKLLDACRAYDSGTRILQSESALACLIRKGVEMVNAKPDEAGEKVPSLPIKTKHTCQRNQ